MKILHDGSNLARRNFHGQNLCTFTGIRTGCIYGTVASMLMIQGLHPADHTLVVWDAEGGSKFRKEIYPHYKGDRGPADPDYIEDRGCLEQLLTAMGVTQVTKPGVECDDIIGFLAMEYYKDEEIIIVSTDKDFYQLISARVRVWNPYKQEFVPYVNGMVPITEAGKTIRLYPNQIADYKALAGDKSDSIPGAQGFGIGAAITFFETNEHIEPILEGKANISQLKSKPLTGLLQAIPFLKKFKDVVTINIEEGRVNIPPRPAYREDMTEALFEHYEFKQFAAMGHKRTKLIGGTTW